MLNFNEENSYISIEAFHYILILLSNFMIFNYVKYSDKQPVYSSEFTEKFILYLGYFMLFYSFFCGVSWFKNYYGLTRKVKLVYYLRKHPEFSKKKDFIKQKYWIYLKLIFYDSLLKQ